MTKENYMALADFQSLWTDKCKPYIKDLHEYKDVYIGAAAASSTIKANAYHHDSITKGRPISISNASNAYIWVILPSTEETAVVMMNGMEVPMTSDGTTTISSKSYKVLKSGNTYTGSFNIFLF